ncbi:hypothetical protein Dimus_001427 [Dionaea muscipula]
MVLAFPTPERYQFGLMESGKSVVDYIDQDTLCIHLEHFTRGLHKAVEATLCLFDTVFHLWKNPGRWDTILWNQRPVLSLFKICLRLLSSGRGSLSPFKAGTGLMNISLHTETTLKVLKGNGFVGRENASAMLLAVWHDRFKVEACNDEAAQGRLRLNWKLEVETLWVPG